jgi:hypothetical protein
MKCFNLVGFFIISSLIQCLPEAIQAAETIENNEEMVTDIESQRNLLNILADGTYDFKETMSCDTLVRSSDPLKLSRGIVNFYRCSDLTISFLQPNSTGINGWNGKCAQTTISNITGMLCNRFISPSTIDSYAYDFTPGNRPATNLKALNKIFAENSEMENGKKNNCPKGNWKEYIASNENQYIENLKSSLWYGPGKAKRKRQNGTTIRITPVAVLISASLKSHHWVTLVDFRKNNSDRFGCDALLNTWGKQKVMTCSDLAKFGDTILFGFRYLTLEQ